MNKSNFNQTGGFPLKTERLQELETAYSIFNAFGMLAGNFTIISGCAQIGSTIGNGFVHINGELLEFRTGTVSAASSVIIIEENVNRAFKNGVFKDVHTLRYATFGTAGTSWPWSTFTRMDTLKSIQARLLPAGTNPQLYSGVIGDIPSGWQLCDGTNGTPNLKSRFIVGYNPDDLDYNTIGKIGGLKEVTLNISQIPAHSHNIKTSSGGGGFIGPQKTNGTQNTSVTESVGGGTAHENRPPYYTLAYIIYKG